MERVQIVMEELKKKISTGLQIKKSILVDSFDGLAKISEVLWNAIEKKNQIFLVGEGIAHAIAQVTATQLFLAAIAKAPKIQSLYSPLTLSSIEFEQVFPAFVESNLQAGDVFIVFAFQGEENYILKSLQKAKAKKVITVVLMGQGHNISKEWINYGVSIASKRDADILETHLMIGNLFCELLKRKISQAKLKPKAVPKAKSEIKQSLPKEKEEEKEEEKGEEDSRFIRFSCQQCEEIIFTESKFAGKKGTCPNCDQKLVVPNISSVSRDEMKGNEKRLSLRYRVHDCLVSYSKQTFPERVDEFSKHGILEDLSDGGCAFVIEGYKSSIGFEKPISIKKTDLLFLLISIPAFNHPFQVKGDVRKVNRIPGRDAVRVGVQFVNLPEKDKEKLKKLESSDVLRNLRRARGIF